MVLEQYPNKRLSSGVHIGLFLGARSNFESALIPLSWQIFNRFKEFPSDVSQFTDSADNIL